MSEFKMPSLGADMDAGILVGWRKNPGDSVRRGDVVAEVETDKGVIEIEAFVDGIFEKTLAELGDKVPVGTALAIIREQGEAAKPAEAARPKAAPASKTASEKQSAPPTPALPAQSRVRASPAAKQLAQELSVDILTVKGTGPGGAVTREDIKEAAKPAPAKPDASEAKRARMREAIAAAMSRSKREIPHYYVSTTIDMAAALAWIGEENKKRPVEERLVYGVLLIKAVALALKEFPDFNALWRDGKAVPMPDIHVGVAVSLRQGGLIAPAMHNTDRQSIVELMKNFLDLVNRARSEALKSSEFSDPTITVTSLGERGVESTYAVIYPPQVAIVGFGKIVERPWAVAGQVVIRPVMAATVSADHRVSDGHRGALFLSAIERRLQEPEKL